MSMTRVLTRSATDPPIRCVANGTYCGALGLIEREAAGKQRVCCRHFLDDDSVVAIYDALYNEEQEGDW